MPITLLPKEKEKKFAISKDLIYGNIAALTAFGALIFVVALYAGLIFYEKKQKQDVADVIERAKAIIQSRDTDLENEAYNLALKLDAAASLLDSHIYSSRVFDLIGNITHPAVQFTKFSFDVETREVFMDAFAVSYTALGEQMIVLEASDKLSDVAISNIRIDKTGQIGFSVSFNIDKSVYGS